MMRILSGSWLLLVLILKGTSLCAQVSVRTEHPIADAPLPNSALAIDAAKGYLLSEIRQKVYYVTDGIYQMMFIVTGKGVVVVDAPPSIGANMLKAIREVTSEPVTHVIYSHSHPDHIGAAQLFPANAIYISGARSARELSVHNKAKGMIPFGAFTGGQPVPTPTLVFTDSMNLVVGNKIIKLLHIDGPAHSAEDIIVYLPAEKIVMLVDIVFPGWIPFEQVAYAVDIDGYQQVQQYILSLNADVLVGGHWSKLGTRQDIINNINYINDILKMLAEGFQQVDFAPIAQRVGKHNINLLMETYFDAVAVYAASKVQAKWIGVLSGTDVWTYSHARRLLSFVRDSQVTITP
ncbi:MAG TPA: MBL fold metallo-hydrolase [Chitinophagaceae bacterium]|nr:MBL fold metallo-hydrolase [Chitinophagaceae bacterium]